MRQWRRREDEQQVRRVSGVRPPPGAPSPNRSPRLPSSRLAAASTPRRWPPSPARAAGWTRPRRPAGRRELGKRGTSVPGTPGQPAPRAKRRGRERGGCAARKEICGRPAPAGAGCAGGVEGSGCFRSLAASECLKPASPHAHSGGLRWSPLLGESFSPAEWGR